jgi:hypothetical protein
MNAPSLLELYQVASKHSHYQVLPAALQPLVPAERLGTKSRHEAARLSYITEKLDFVGLRVADIGGNTGYFSFELLARGAQHVDYYEGNKAHHDFVRAAAAQLGLSDRLRTVNRYFSFAPDDRLDVDCTLLLNVLHHLGDDFGGQGLSREVAKQRMLTCLATLSRSSRYLVLQVGFCWKGDRQQSLFPHGTKAELTEFIRTGTALDWEVKSVGVAVRSGDAITFSDLDASNIARDDTLGEFLNRPLFIMQSKHR